MISLIKLSYKFAIYLQTTMNKLDNDRVKRITNKNFTNSNNNAEIN